MLKIFCIGAAGLILFACNNAGNDSVEKADSANAARQDSSTVSDGKALLATDEASSAFLVRALDGGMMEVALGNVASQRSASARVKAFGQMMVMDHGDANATIRNLAMMRTVTLPQGTSDDKTKMIQDLSAKSGEDFDREYIDMMVEDHKKDISEFESAAKKVQDTAVAAFIRTAIPVLKKHLDSCTAIRESLSKKNK